MPQLIKETKVEVKNGELIVSINLDLNINLTTNSVSVSAKNVESDEKKWEVPDFKGIGKIKFGKFGKVE